MMKWKTFVIGYGLALALLLFAQHRPAHPETGTFTRIVDLTHSIIHAQTITSPNSPITQAFPLQPEPVADVVHYNPSRRSEAERFPTRLDAPAHAGQGLWTVDQIPPQRLFAPLVVIDVGSQARTSPDYQLSVADIARWEEVHGQVPQGAVVMAHTGWGARWPSSQQYRPVDKHGVAHFPGFSLQAARFLIEGRNVVGLGIDTAGVDPGNAADAPVRRYALSHSVYQIENVANLAKAPKSGGLVLVAPAKLQGSSSAPVRVLALAK